MRGLMVMGAGFGVGTTTVAAGLLAALSKRGLEVAPFKPVELGCLLLAKEQALVDGMPGPVDARGQQSLDRLRELMGAAPAALSAKTAPEALRPVDAERLLKAVAGGWTVDEINPYRYAAEVAPAVAASMAERPIELSVLVESARGVCPADGALVVDGGGALLEPLGKGTSMLELAMMLQLPLLLVGTTERSAIGPLLAQLEVARAKGVAVAGVVLNRRERRPRPEEAATPLALELAAGDVVRGVLPALGEEAEDGEVLARRCEVHIDLAPVVEVMGLAQ